MQQAESGLIFRGIRPLQKLGSVARQVVKPLTGMSLPLDVPHALSVVPPDPWPGDTQRGRDMVAGTFCFAGQTVEKEDLSWEPAGASAEWLAALHGFEWLRDLRSVGGEKARRMAREMAALWLARYRKYDETAWRADIMGARLKSWISFHDFFCATADDAFRADYFSSLVQQAKHLAKVLPKENLSGIPVMQALKGLAYSGLALEGGEARLEQAFSGILHQIREQILPDGGHVSRSPQAAFEFLQCLVDLRMALIAAKIEMPEELQHAIDRIAPAVRFFIHGDGALAQFNGGQEGNAHFCETTLMHSGARGKAMQALPHSGYERIVQGRSSLVMDTGLPLVSSYTGRAHAGLLSFEYSFGRDRVIVNCGTSEANGKWRRILRSTLAHSTLIADNRNSCQFDAEGLLASRPDVRAKRGEEEGISMIEASHNGYVPRFGLVHRRCVRLMEQGDVLCGEDQLTGKSGVPFTVRFHLHPDIRVELSEGGDEIFLNARSGMTWMFRAAGAKMALEESIYAGKGDSPRPSLQIVLTGQTTGPATTLGWELRRERG